MDRNVFGFGAKLVHSLSLSVRRAWIEITRWNPNRLTRPVALRKESVDRNIIVTMIQTGLGRRSP